MKRIINLIILFLILQGCSLDLKNLLKSESTDEQDTQSVQIRDEFNNLTNTRKYYEDDVLKWIEYHDFDNDKKCIMIKRITTNESVLTTKIYTWSGNNLIQQSIYGPEDNILSSISYDYNSDTNINQVNQYDSSNTLEYTTTYEYSNETVIDSRKYDNNDELVWAYLHDIDEDLNIIRSEYYDNTKELVAYNDYTFSGTLEIEEYLSMSIGYGETTATTTFKSSPSIPSFKTPGDEEVLSRNTSELTKTDIPSSKSINNDFLENNISLPYTWMKLNENDDYGTLETLLNNNYKPTYISRSLIDYDNPIIIDFEYDDSGYLKSKTTSYDNKELLLIELANENDIYSIDVSGDIMPLPVELDLTLSENNIPEKIDIYSNETLLLYFEYEYTIAEEELTFDNFTDNIYTIKQYDGDKELKANYIFTYSDLEIVINVTDSEDVSTGYFKVGYDANGNNTYLKSYNNEDELIWNYSYDFKEVSDDVTTKISEINLDEDDIPTVITDFDYMSIITDIKSYIPFDI